MGNIRHQVDLKPVLLFEGQVLLVEGIHTINHLLDQLNLGVSQSVLVGDVIGHAGLTTRFSPGTTGLQMELLTPGLQGFKTLLGVAREVNVDGGTHASTQVGGAGVDITILGIKHEVLARLSLH